MRDQTRRHLMLISTCQDVRPSLLLHGAHNGRKAPRIRRLSRSGPKESGMEEQAQEHLRGEHTRVCPCSYPRGEKPPPPHRLRQSNIREVFWFCRDAHKGLPEKFQHCAEPGQSQMFCRSTAEAVHSSATDIDRESVQDVHRTVPTMHRLWTDAPQISMRVHSLTMTSQCSA